MKKILILIVIFISHTAFALDAKPSSEPAWKADLARDLVTVQDGVMTMDEAGVLAISTVPRTELRVRIRCDAPVRGVVSRDNFVAVTTALYNSIFVGVVSGLLPELPAAKIGSVFDFRSDAQSKESSDITISISLDVKGILIQVSNARNANVQKYPIPWEQYFGSLAGSEAEKAGAEEPTPAEPKADKGSPVKTGDK